MTSTSIRPTFFFLARFHQRRRLRRGVMRGLHRYCVLIGVLSAALCPNRGFRYGVHWNFFWTMAAMAAAHAVTVSAAAAAGHRLGWPSLLAAALGVSAAVLLPGTRFAPIGALPVCEPPAAVLFFSFFFFFFFFFFFSFFSSFSVFVLVLCAGLNVVSPFPAPTPPSLLRTHTCHLSHLRGNRSPRCIRLGSSSRGSGSLWRRARGSDSSPRTRKGS